MLQSLHWRQVLQHATVVTSHDCESGDPSCNAVCNTEKSARSASCAAQRSSADPTQTSMAEHLPESRPIACLLSFTGRRSGAREVARGGGGSSQ